MSATPLRVDRRDDGVVIADPRAARAAQRDDRRADPGVDRRDGRAAGRSGRPRGRRDRRGQRVLLGRRPVLDRGVARPHRRRDPRPDVAVLSRLAGNSRPRGARRSPRSTAPRSAPACASRSPAICGTPRRGATLSAPFTALGMHAGMAATWLLPEAVGLPVARELLFTGRRVDADEALRIGLVNGVFESDALLDGALGVARRIAANGPVAVRLTVAGLRNGGHSSLEAALQYEALAQPVTFATPDLAEGLAAAKERRRRDFTGGSADGEQLGAVLARAKAKPPGTSDQSFAFPLRTSARHATGAPLCTTVRTRPAQPSTQGPEFGVDEAGDRAGDRPGVFAVDDRCRSGCGRNLWATPPRRGDLRRRSPRDVHSNIVSRSSAGLPSTTRWPARPAVRRWRHGGRLGSRPGLPRPGTLSRAARSRRCRPRRRSRRTRRTSRSSAARGGGVPSPPTATADGSSSRCRRGSAAPKRRKWVALMVDRVLASERRQRPSDASSPTRPPSALRLAISAVGRGRRAFGGSTTWRRGGDPARRSTARSGCPGGWTACRRTSSTTCCCTSSPTCSCRDTGRRSGRSSPATSGSSARVASSKASARGRTVTSCMTERVVAVLARPDAALRRTLVARDAQRRHRPGRRYPAG